MLGPRLVFGHLDPKRQTWATLGLAIHLIAASAPGERLRLEWTAPSECPTIEQVRKDVNHLLMDQSASNDEPVTATVTIQQKADGYSLSFSANGQTRVIDGENCTELAQAAALLLALLVDPARARALSGEATDQAPDTPALEQPALPVESPTRKIEHAQPAPPSAATTKENADALPATPTVRPIVELGARVDLGSWPLAEPAVLAGFGFESDRWRWLAHASLGKKVQLHSSSGDVVDLFVASFDTAAAYRLKFGNWSLEPGVSAELGLTHASTRTLLPADKNAVSVSALGVTRVSRHFGRALRAWFEPGVGYPLIRPRWVIQAGEQLHQSGAFARLQAGLLLAF